MVEKFNDGMQFLRGVHREFTKVVWPTKSELIGSTTIVLLLVVFFAVYVGIVDFVFSGLAARIF